MSRRVPVANSSGGASALDSYIEKKRAMEERAKQIKMDRNSNKDGIFMSVSFE